MAAPISNQAQGPAAPSPGRGIQPWVWVAVGVVVVALVGCLGLSAAAVGWLSLRGGQDQAQTDDPPTSLPPVTSKCSYTGSPGRPDASGKQVGLPPPAPTAAPATRTVTIETNRGTIGMRLDAERAPCPVHSFLFLAGRSYYDGTACHRLTTEGLFVLQCGDPTGTGTGGPGYQFAEENLPTSQHPSYPRGTVAMANAGPGTNGSQFFIVYRDTEIDPNYTIFGQVTQGLDIVEAVAAGGTDNTQGPGDGKPKLPIVLRSVTVS
ncbi:MAG TPA: peptidylprolyl isomerase [Cryptosporangiaceae bacterium]|nr:peptidylprolyl isomerase [Cryptosporangiaceae bacterium]